MALPNKNTLDQPETPAYLRQRAEEINEAEPGNLPEAIADLTQEQIQQTLQELRVHQIELKMQNEELRRAQVELDQARERYFDLYDLAPVGYCTISENGLILETNLTAASLLGITRNVMKQQPISHFILKNDQDIYYLHRKQLFETGLAQSCALRMVKNDGSIFWTHMTASVTEDPSGVTLCRVVISDISELKQVESDLKKHQALLKETEKTGKIGGWEFNVEKLIQTWTEEIFRILEIDLTRGEPTVPAGMDFILPAYRPMAEQGIQRAIAFGEPYDQVWEVITAQGNHRWVHSVGTPHQENGKIKTVSGSFQDITDRKQAEDDLHQLNAELEQRVHDRTAQLESSNKELEAFAFSVSHDLRAPLRAINGFASMLQQEHSHNLDEEGMRLLGVVRSNATKMDRLITDLLALSRLSTSELTNALINMSLLVKSVYHDLASPEVLEKFQIEISELPNAWGDPILLRQIWVNLISNAIKFTLPKTDCIIEISGSKKDGFTIYTIKDNGVGFNQDYADKLFVLFQQLHSVGEFEGAGVGLAIVKRIIHRHGGEVWGQAQVGKGATFTFTLPNKLQ